MEPNWPDSDSPRGASGSQSPLREDERITLTFFFKYNFF